MRIAVAATALAVALSASPAASAQAPDTDYMKRAGNFLKNCDARANADGERPEPNFVCLGFMAGLIEGYTYAAIANGNPRPYCLPRPATLAELADMMTTVIERGVPADLPTAAVFHFILDQNFKCAPQETQAPSEGIETAQNVAQEVLPEGGATLPIVEPAGEAQSEPQLPVVAPSQQPGVAGREGASSGKAAPAPTAKPANDKAESSVSPASKPELESAIKAKPAAPAAPKPPEPPKGPTPVTVN
ncbi:MAG: hypothetical protein AAFW98_02285 [Pseudomonadota bacterium]